MITSTINIVPGESRNETTSRENRDENSKPKKEHFTPNDVKEECKRKMQEEWGYEGVTSKRLARYAEVHKRMLGTDATAIDTRFYDEIKDSKSSILGQMKAKYGEGPKQFHFCHPETGQKITLEDNDEQYRLREWCRDVLYFGFGNAGRLDNGRHTWDYPGVNRGKMQTI